MLLFIHPLISPALFIISEWGKILHKEVHDIRGKEFETFPEILHGLVKKYFIAKIAVVNGPWPFTALRIVTLALNTLSLVKHIPLIPVHFFELWVLQKKPLPYCLKANRGEYLIRSSDMEMLTALHSMKGSYWGMGDMNDSPENGILIDNTIDMQTILPILEKREWTSMIAPLYIKDPKITPPRKPSP